MGKKKRNLRIHREGRNIIVGLTFLIFAINVPIYLFVASNWIFAITLLLSAALLVFVTYFFRNPVRNPGRSLPHGVVGDGHLILLIGVRPFCVLLHNLEGILPPDCAVTGRDELKGQVEA